MFFSVIIPVYNRPDDLEDLLPDLAAQTYKNFEVLIIESGSTIPSDEVISRYKDKLSINHLTAGNDGQGFSRNMGMKYAKGDYFVILDSDLFLDKDYLQHVKNGIERDQLDCFGGPDRAHDSFTDTQKAVDYAMTSPLTTGGIRGNSKHVGTFYPRSFNMGFSRKVYEQTLGFKFPFFGEDIELSRRIMSLGFKVGLIPEAFVYHKRKNSLSGLYKQTEFFGRARIQIYHLFPDTLKITHFFPTFFVLYCVFTVLICVVNWQYGQFLMYALMLYLLANYNVAYLKYKSPIVARKSVGAVFAMMFGYGWGFLKDFVRKIIFRQNPYFKNKDNDDRK